jgi:hypothetical protein
MVCWKVAERNSEALSLITRSSRQPRLARSAATCRARALVHWAEGVRLVTWRVAQAYAEATSMAVYCHTVPFSPAQAADAAAIQLHQLPGMINLQVPLRHRRGPLRLGGAGGYLPTSGPRTSDALACRLGAEALALADRQQVTTNLQDVRRLRLDLEPWRDTQAVRELDDQLAAVGSTGA